MTARPWPDLSSNRRRPLSPRPERLGWLTPVPEEERRGETALHARLNRDGSLYLRGLIAPETVLDFRRSFLETLAPSGLTRPAPAQEGLAGPHPDAAEVRATLFCSARSFPASERYEGLCRAPELLGVFRNLLGPNLHLHRRKLIRHVRPDDSYTTPAHYNLVYLPDGTNRLLSDWIPLGDVPVEQGGLVYLEGTTAGARPSTARQTGRRSPRASPSTSLRSPPSTTPAGWWRITEPGMW